MSAKATFWAWEQPIKPATAKLVLLCLADCHNADTGQCFPSIKYISRVSGLDRKTVISNIDNLYKMNLLDVKKTKGSGSVYYLCIGQKSLLLDTRTGTENGTTTSTEIGTGTENGTGPENGTAPVPKTVPPPVPKTVPKPKREPTKNLKERECARKVVEAYHRILPELTGIRNLSDNRIKQINARCAEVEENGGWESCFQAVRGSEFLMGNNQRGWKADLEWITKSENMNKLIEGKYH